MKGLSAGLTFFSCSVVSAVLLGLVAGGLGPMTTWLSILIAVAAAVIAYFATVDPGTPPLVTPNGRSRFGWIPFWFMVGCFTLFAVRSFCWLLYVDGPEFRIQSVNNLGDLALHVTYIKTFANGVPIWPDNPIYVGSHLRYPAGVDIFNGLLLITHVDLIRGLVWVGLLASIATFYGFYRWGGLFGVAGFLFNGGVVGLAFLSNLEFKDYQGTNNIAWKSIPLSMFVTQRGLLYAIPAGILLLWHWREKFYGAAIAGGGDAGSEVAASDADRRPQRRVLRGPLPFWAELLIYCSMPLFHVHTFLALSAVLVFLFLLGNAPQRLHTVKLVAAAVIPATFLVWMITDHFGARSMIKWQPGWVQNNGDFAHPLGAAHAVTGGGFLRHLDQVIEFWVFNFGFWVALMLSWIVLVAVQTWRSRSSTMPADRPSIPVEIVPTVLTVTLLAILAPCFTSWWYLVLLPILAIPGTLFVRSIMKRQRLPVSMNLVFTSAAVALFLFGYLFKTAPWEWDNLKLMFWGYFMVLPFLWNGLISQWVMPLRIVACIVLFGSGFVSLFGGLSVPGYGFANRAEVAQVAVAVRDLPMDARFATFPTFNHPVLLQGRKVVLGYPGHLWTQGFDNYHEEETKLNRLMHGEVGWQEAARALQVRYIFWGREENTNYPNSTHPWESTLTKISSGPWGAIYDLKRPIAP